jgi:uncharacterized protein with NRDE domain
VCLLALRFQVVDGAPVALAANRDESLARAFDPPRLHPGAMPYLAPVDRTAGGTWLGLNAAGLVVAVTNRPQRETTATRRSRGLLVADSLRARSTARLRDALERHLRHGPAYNNFHLLVADAASAFVVRYSDGWPEFSDLEPGDHFLTNEDELDEASVPSITDAVAPSPRAEAERLARALAEHGPVLPGGRAPCKHDGGRGTVSASVILLGEEGLRDAVFRFSPGPPCTTDLLDHANELEVLRDGAGAAAE